MHHPSSGITGNHRFLVTPQSHLHFAPCSGLSPNGQFNPTLHHHVVPKHCRQRQQVPQLFHFFSLCLLAMLPQILRTGTDRWTTIFLVITLHNSKYFTQLHTLECHVCLATLVENADGFVVDHRHA